MKFNVACKSEAIDPVIERIGITVLGKCLNGFLKKTLYESDVGEGLIEITLVPIVVSDNAFCFTKHILTLLKAIPGVIFIEPVREEVITYDIDT